MNHGGYPGNDWPNSIQYYSVAVVGAGAAAPTAPPGLTAVLPDFPRKCNALSSLASEIPTRSGVGAYIVTVDSSFKLAQWLDAPCNVFGTVGAWAQVSVMSAANRTLTVKVFAAAGSAADLAVGDTLVIDIKGRDSLA